MRYTTERNTEGDADQEGQHHHQTWDHRNINIKQNPSRPDTSPPQPWKRLRARPLTQGTGRTLNSLQPQPSKTSSNGTLTTYKPQQASPHSNSAKENHKKQGQTTRPIFKSEIPQGWSSFTQNDKSKQSQAFRNSSSILAGFARTQNHQE